MTPKKATYVLSGILVLVISVGIGAFYVGDQALKERSAEISSEKADLEAVKTELAIYQDSKEKVGKYGFVDELSSKVLPENKFQSEVVAELTSFATSSGMRIQSLTFGAGDANVSDPNLSQTETIEGLNGVRVLSASIQFATEPPATYTDFLSFLRQIENNQRKMEVTTLSITPSPENPQLLASATVTINIFLKGTIVSDDTGGDD